MSLSRAVCLGYRTDCSSPQLPYKGLIVESLDPEEKWKGEFPIGSPRPHGQGEEERPLLQPVEWRTRQGALPKLIK
jgi:hypothetical protein